MIAILSPVYSLFITASYVCYQMRAADRIIKNLRAPPLTRLIVPWQPAQLLHQRIQIFQPNDTVHTVRFPYPSTSETSPKGAGSRLVL